MTISDKSIEAGMQVKHLKRGSTYEVVGRAELQTSEELPDGADLVVYRSLETNELWVRSTHEFADGRFELLTPEHTQSRDWEAIESELAGIKLASKTLLAEIGYFALESSPYVGLINAIAKLRATVEKE